MIDDLSEYIEDILANEVYKEFDGSVVDEFIQNMDEDILTPKIQDIIEDLNNAIQERIKELIDDIVVYDSEHEDEDF